jgi:hypothetical protein
MTYKEALLKNLSGLFETQDMRVKAMFALLRKQLEAISEEQAKQIVIQAAKVLKKIEADIKLDVKISPSAKR